MSVSKKVSRVLVGVAVGAGVLVAAPAPAMAAAPTDLCGVSTNDLLTASLLARTFTGTIVHTGEQDTLKVTFYPGQETQVYITGPTANLSTFANYETDASNGVGVVSFETPYGYALWANQSCNTSGSPLVNEISGTTGDGSHFQITG